MEGVIEIDGVKYAPVVSEEEEEDEDMEILLQMMKMKMMKIWKKILIWNL